MAEQPEPPAPPPRFPRSLLLRGVRIAAVCLLGLVLLMLFIENRMVYPAPPLDRSDWAPIGLAFEDVFFESADGTRLHGWFFEQPRTDRSGAGRAVLYCHGNGEQVADNGPLMAYLSEQLDAAVLVFDYRGYGKSGGRPSERGVVADGLAAQRWLANRTGRRADQVVLIGRSIGGGVATACAAELGAEALVLQSTFTRLTDAAAHHFPWLPVRWLMRNRFDSVRRIAAYPGPVFASHGTRDQVVPFQQGQNLFDEAPTDRKQFFRIDGGRHNDPQPQAYYPALRAFLDGLSSTAIDETRDAEPSRQAP